MKEEGYYLAKFLETEKNIHEALLEAYKEYLEPLIDGSNFFSLDDDMNIIAQSNPKKFYKPIYILGNQEQTKSTIEKGLGCILNKVNLDEIGKEK